METLAWIGRELGKARKYSHYSAAKTSGITVYALGSCSSQTVSHSKLSGAETGDQSNLESYQMLRCLNILTLLNVGPYLLPPSPPPPFHIWGGKLANWPNIIL